jgi:hypothetical protein
VASLCFKRAATLTSGYGRHRSQRFRLEIRRTVAVHLDLALSLQPSTLEGIVAGSDILPRTQSILA